MLKHRVDERFLKENFSLAAIDDRHCRSCTRKPSTSGQPGIKCILQPIEVTVTRVPESRVLADHEPIKLSRSANTLSELGIGYSSVTAV